MIKTKYMLIFLSLLVVAVILFLIIRNKTEIYKSPNANVILIVVDTLRADHLGCYGYYRNTSPEIDKLASEGIIFKNMFAHSSWTLPTTASILSGLYPNHHCAHSTKFRISDEIDLLPEILVKHGYRSYAFVANSMVSNAVGFNQGYKKFTLLKETAVGNAIHASSDAVNNALKQFIQQLKAPRNNFIYIHYVDPHHPYTPREKKFSKSNRIEFTSKFNFYKGIKEMSKDERSKLIGEMINAYDDEILYNDKMIGNLLQMLKKKKMYSNSIIIVTSDHGEEFWEHGKFTHGKSLYDEQLKVPLIICLPDRIHKTVNETANQVDILPTILSLLEVPIPKNIDGIDLLKNKKTHNRLSYAELMSSKTNLFSIRTSKYKLIEGISPSPTVKGKHRWFRKRALLEIDGDSLELIIKSFYKNRSIQILSDGEPIKELEITPVKQTFNIALPGTKKKKTVAIKSLAPCQVPKKVGTSKDNRCLAFCIFNSKNIKAKNVFDDIHKEYYILTDDPEENSNKYNQHKYKKIIVDLRKKLKKYLSSSHTGRNKKPVKFDKKQIEALKALGYIN